MEDTQIAEATHRVVWFLGPIPPPVTGITIMTGEVLRSLQAAGPVHFLNWSAGTTRRGIGFRLRRVGRALNALVELVRHGRVQDTKLYLTANSSGSGLLLTGLAAALAHQLGYRIYLHHHSYSYIDEHDWRMAWIDRNMGCKGVHIVHADQMIDDFCARYSTRCSFMTIFPSIVAQTTASPKDSCNRPFCLGHLSNLTPDKGLDLVLATFAALKARKLPVRLKLAGPFHTRSAKAMVEQAIAEYGGEIEYVGPVHNETKAKFLNGLDVFLFPTRYKNESWGIVLHEALAAGCPVITFDRGCTRTVVGGRAGLILESDADFVARAADQIEHWASEPDTYRAVSRAAIEQAEYLHSEGQRMLAEFTSCMFSIDASAAKLRPTDLSATCKSAT